MIATTLSPLEVHVSNIIESDSVSEVDKFLTELAAYGIDDVEHFDDAYSGCYRSEADFCEDLVTDTCSEQIDSLPMWVQTAIDWEMVWHQTMQYDYFSVYFDGEYYIFNRNV